MFKPSIFRTHFRLPFSSLISSISLERACRSQVHLTAPAKGFPGLKAYVDQLMAANPKYFLANQFYNEANPDIHYKTTGPEIWEQVMSAHLQLAWISRSRLFSKACLNDSTPIFERRRLLFKHVVSSGSLSASLSAAAIYCSDCLCDPHSIDGAIGGY